MRGEAPDKNCRGAGPRQGDQAPKGASREAGKRPGRWNREKNYRWKKIVGFKIVQNLKTK